MPHGTWACPRARAIVVSLMWCVAAVTPAGVFGADEIPPQGAAANSRGTADRDGPAPAAEPRATLDALWDQLGGETTSTAFAAVWTLSDTPDAAAYFVRSTVGRFCRVRLSAAGRSLIESSVRYVSATSLASAGRKTSKPGIARSAA